MDFNLINNIEICRIFKDEAPMSLVRYSHIPTLFLSMLIGIYVYVKNRHSLISKILLGISISFSSWILSSLVIWELGYNSVLTMFFWSLLGISNALISLLCLYFVYVFLDKKDISFTKKIVFSILLLPVIILTPTKLNLASFDVAYCNAIEWKFFSPYYYMLGLLVAAWIIVIAISRYRKADQDTKKQIILITIGVDFLVVLFAAVGFIINYLVSKELLQNFNLEMYALMGMPIFIGFLGYLIVKFKAFNIKLVAVQALVAGLVILIGSELFFAESATNQILILVTLGIAVGFGYMLIKSVKLEIQRKEELQLMSDKLALANDQLRKLDNAKSEFISIASHQLRTPLTAIKGFVSLLLEESYGKISAEVRETLNKVYHSNERLIALVEDMLNLSRIESGRMEYKYEKVNMPELLHEVYDTFIIRAKEKKLGLELNLPEGNALEITTDRNKIREVISNVVDNGLKYTLKGSVRIKLEDLGESARVSVIDTGIGVPKDETSYLFQKFSRGKDISRLNTGGTGLGLHVGRKMIEALGGIIRVESEGAGHGSTFIIEVPKEHKEEE